MRYALIITATGLVENVIEYDPAGTFPIAPGYEVVRSDVANIGMIYADGEFSWPEGHGAGVAQTEDTGNGNPPSKPPI